MSLFAPSFMDKLLAVDADASPRGAAMRINLEQAKESVARDIETLLNARPTVDASAAGRYPQVAHSLLTFGLPDIASLSIASDRDRLRISEAIRRALADHEQRLSQVEVAVVTTAAVGAGLRFSIRAQLGLTPASEPVAFDAVLHPGSKRYAISRSRPRGASSA